MEFVCEADETQGIVASKKAVGDGAADSSTARAPTPQTLRQCYVVCGLGEKLEVLSPAQRRFDFAIYWEWLWAAGVSWPL